MESKKYQNVHVLKLQKGEKVREMVNQYVTQHQIGFAKLEAIGMLGEVKLGYLNEQGSYDWKVFEEGELIAFLGNIAWSNNEVVMHAHASLGLANYQVVGGHFQEAIVTGVMELFITELSKEKIKREDSPLVSFKTWAL